jgi:hypothetical protein
MEKFKRTAADILVLKTLVFFVAIICGLFWNLLVFMDTANGYEGPFTWGRSLAANLAWLFIFSSICAFSFTKIKSKIFSFFVAGSIYIGGLFGLGLQSVVLPLFINPGPILYKEIMEKCPDQTTLMDTTHVYDFVHEAYYADIRRWNKYWSLDELGCK